MNYYRRYPGDYARDTKQLSMLEHGAYCLLLDVLYSTEKPLPTHRPLLYRICSAFTKREKKAVEFVLSEFFTENPVGFTNHRFEKEITYAESRAKASRKNGQFGGRPPKQKPTANPEHNPEKSSPYSILHTPDKRREEKRNTYARTWPDDLVLLPAMSEYAKAHGVPDPAQEFDAWHDDCLAHGRKYVNWPAAWRTRVSNYGRFNGGRNGKPTESFQERNIRVADQELSEVSRRARQTFSKMGEGPSKPENRLGVGGHLFGSPK